MSGWLCPGGDFVLDLRAASPIDRNRARCTHGRILPPTDFPLTSRLTRFGRRPMRVWLSPFLNNVLYTCRRASLAIPCQPLNQGSKLVEWSPRAWVGPVFSTEVQSIDSVRTQTGVYRNVNASTATRKRCEAIDDVDVMRHASGQHTAFYSICFVHIFAFILVALFVCLFVCYLHYIVSCFCL